MNNQIYIDDKLTLADKFIIILLLCTVFFLIFQQKNKKNCEHIEAEIIVNSQKKLLFSLSEDRQLFLDVKNKPFLISIKEDALWVSKTLCPNKICIHRGPISLPGETIVCVPNKVIISLKGRSKRKPQIDCIAQ